MQISVMLHNFRLPFEAALDTTLLLGIPAVQLMISEGDDSATRRRMSRAVKACGLQVSAIAVDVGDLGEAETAEARIEAAKPLMDAAMEFGGICQTHVGIMPHAANGLRWDSFLRCGEALAAYGEKIGACLALETGPEPARVMEKLMRAIDSPGLRVNYDPANLIIWPAMLPLYPELVEQTGQLAHPYERIEAERDFEPVEGVRRLGSYIVHTHAKDATGNGGWGDVPLGIGWVNWPRYLKLLQAVGQAVGYDGFLTIEREAGDDRIGEVKHAVEFLREQLQRIEDEKPRAERD